MRAKNTAQSSPIHPSAEHTEDIKLFQSKSLIGSTIINESPVLGQLGRDVSGGQFNISPSVVPNAEDHIISFCPSPTEQLAATGTKQAPQEGNG